MKKANSPFYQRFLRHLMAERLEANPNYSVRAAAKSMKVSSGALSEILSGARPLSLKMAERILHSLDLNLADEEAFIDSVVETQQKRDLKRRDPRTRIQRSSSVENQELIDQDKYQLVADWYHAAILELTFADDFQNDTQWIAHQLNISPTQAKLAIDRLISLDLLKNEQGHLVKTTNQLNIKDKALRTNKALKRKQKQIRQLAIEAIDGQPLESRQMSTMTMCIDPELLPEARRQIEEFTQNLCKKLESKNRKKVYALEVGLFSLQKIKGEKS